MNGFNVYLTFIALKNHFTQARYDYFQYHGRLKLTEEAYRKRPSGQQYLCDKFSKHFPDKQDLENFIVANLLATQGRSWLSHLNTSEAADHFAEWIRRTASLEQTLINDVRVLMESSSDPHAHFNALFVAPRNGHPAIFKALLGREVTLESFLLLDACVGFCASLDEQLKDDQVWLRHRFLHNKYRPFLLRLPVEIKLLRRGVQNVLTPDLND